MCLLEKIIPLEELESRHAILNTDPSVIMLGRKRKVGIPKVSKKYYAYDDGKISPSREYMVEVKKIYSYNELPDDIKLLWQQDVLSTYWLMAPKSDAFIQCKDCEDKSEHWFARTRFGGWFDFNTESSYNQGELDVTGRLHKLAHN